ncbi:MAG: hypothetical protein ACK4PI_09815 [Tepidisphaerales bacterium]
MGHGASPAGADPAVALGRALRWHRLALVSLLALAAGVAMGRLASPQRATRFELVDDGDRVLATLARGPDGRAVLTFFDADGKAVRAITAADDVPQRLSAVEGALAAVQQHLLLRERAGVGPVFPPRPDLLDDLRRDQNERELERLARERRERERELQRQLDEQRRLQEQLRREQERRELDRHLFPGRP